MTTYARYYADDGPRLAQVLGDDLVDLIGPDGRPLTMIDAILAGTEPDKGGTRTADDVRLLAPHPKPPRNLICVGKNYRDHAAEFAASGFDQSGAPEDDEQFPFVVFTKPYTSIIGPKDAIEFDPESTTSIDYEVELAVVIGSTGRRITPQRALDHVFGYTIVNDVTARDVQHRHRQWFIGKSFDTFCPMGPVLVTAETLDISDLRLRTLVNGELRQNASTADLIYDVPNIISRVSQNMTLLPGDVIATGTPAGVGIGFDPPKFLEHGDLVTTSIDGIGALSNPVVHRTRPG